MPRVPLTGVQGYLDHKKQRPSRTLQQIYFQGPMAALRRGAVSDEFPAHHSDALE